MNALHNNKLEVGLNIGQIKTPKIRVETKGIYGNYEPSEISNIQISASSLLSYLGIKGVGTQRAGVSGGVELYRHFNALPILAYYDIFKNYYANTQEQSARYIGGTPPIAVAIENVLVKYDEESEGVPLPQTLRSNVILECTGQGLNNANQIEMNFADGTKCLFSECTNIQVYDGGNKISGKTTVSSVMYGKRLTSITGKGIASGKIEIKEVSLRNFDEAREKLLTKAWNSEVIINEDLPEPYNLLGRNDNNTKICLSKNEMFGIMLKTYQSDIFNNWVRTEWIDGVNGINQITSIDTSDGKFDLNTLNMSKKLYNLLTKISLSGGTYKNWIEVAFDEDSYFGIEIPLYKGGMSQEIVFNEVISNSATENEPLGTLAGKGTLRNNKKGGKIFIKVKEPSYILGIISITPRLDYSQGNDWDMSIKNMDEWHKPSLDGIGFQDLITDKMAWWDTLVDENGAILYHSIGKQPAWIDYTTSFNKCYGNFAEQNKEMYMTLNRRYGAEYIYSTWRAKDLTTYIDPTKYNYIFAQTDLYAMNFWVQVAKDIKAKRVMSNRLIPNV